MNAIYLRNKPKDKVKKRKYVRKPLCENLGGHCTFKKCICHLSVYKNKGLDKPIDEEVLHRDKVIKRRREIELMRLDAENSFIIEQALKDKNFRVIYKGYIPPKRVDNKILWKGLLIILGAVVVYPIVIFIGDLIK